METELDTSDHRLHHLDLAQVGTVTADLGGVRSGQSAGALVDFDRVEVDGVRWPAVPPGASSTFEPVRADNADGTLAA